MAEAPDDLSGMTDGDVTREPPAAMRTAAAALRNMHLALLREGFSPNEAPSIIGVALSAQISKG